jgi:hypothetical protein
MEQYQQGDIILIRVDDVPSDGVEVQPDKPVLAHGEVTGHMHQVLGEKITWVVPNDEETPTYQFDQDPSQMLWVVAPEGFDLVHGDENGQAIHEGDRPHAPIAVPPGTYRVTRQRVLDLSSEHRTAMGAEASRWVAD